jgi:1-acyl-sn-glycerol-3-phosphate acyltransferase
VGAGSLLSERFSGRSIEVGLVPLGSIGLTVFLIAAFFTLPLHSQGPISATFWSNTPAIHFGIYLGLSGVFGGFYIVPMYALIQSRCNPHHVASVISANNILNSAFMVVAAALGALSAWLHLPTPWLVLFAGVFNCFVAVYIYTLLPEFLWRFIVWILVHTIYRFKVKGLDNIPNTGPCILVCNHIGFSDPVILAAAVQRPLRFIMDYKIFDTLGLGWFFKTAKAIPIAPKAQNPETFEKVFEKVKKALDEGEIICIFPEGRLTTDGEIGVFKPGLLRILESNPVPVIPAALGGLWGSLFSRKNKGLWKRLTNTAWGRPIDLHIGPSIEAKDIQMTTLKVRVQELRTRP